MAWFVSDGWLKFFKYFLYFFNAASLMTSLAVCTIGVWIRCDWDFKEYVHQLEMYHFWTGAYILIAASVIVMVLSAFGCFGAITENPFILSLYGVLLVICFILELAGLAYILDNGTLWSKMTWWLRDKFYELIYKSDENPRMARILRIIQEEVGCCGSYSSLDYINVNKPVPPECRDHNTGNEYEDGCYITFSRFLETRSGWIAGFALLLCCLQILGIIASFMLRYIVNRMATEGKVYDPVKTKSRA